MDVNGHIPSRKTVKRQLSRDDDDDEMQYEDDANHHYSDLPMLLLKATVCTPGVSREGDLWSQDAPSLPLI